MVCASLVACGGESDPADDLKGTWALEISSSCALISVFNDSDYVMALGCQLTGGQIGTETETGAYSVSGDQLTMTAQKATCSDVTSAPKTMRFAVNGDSLSLVDDNGALVFKKVPASSGGGSSSGAVLQQGCYVMGRFLASSLKPVP